MEIDISLDVAFEAIAYEWREYESLRKAQIERANPNPLHCTSCDKSVTPKYYK